MTPKEEIKEEFKKCFDRINVLIAGLTDIPAEQTKVEVGKVYMLNHGGIVYVTKYLGGNEALGYGFGCSGSWIEPDDTESWEWESLTPVPLSEWTELLDKERVKRGLVAGAKIERPEEWIWSIDKVCYIDANGEAFYIDEDQDGFYHGAQVYANGIWAKVIKDEDIYVNGEKVVFEGNYARFGMCPFHRDTIRLFHSIDRETLDKIVGRLK